MHDGVHALSARLERRSPIGLLDGSSFEIALIDIREPESPVALHIDVVVGATYKSEKFTGELHLGRDRLEDLDYVEEAAVQMMKRIVTGDLPPGARDLL